MLPDPTILAGSLYRRDTRTERDYVPAYPPGYVPHDYSRVKSFLSVKPQAHGALRAVKTPTPITLVRKVQNRKRADSVRARLVAELVSVYPQGLTTAEMSAKLNAERHTVRSVVKLLPGVEITRHPIHSRERIYALKEVPND